jgi:hypothetical protein
MNQKISVDRATEINKRRENKDEVNREGVGRVIRNEKSEGMVYS